MSVYIYIYRCGCEAAMQQHKAAARMVWQNGQEWLLLDQSRKEAVLIWCSHLQALLGLLSQPSMQKTNWSSPWGTRCPPQVAPQTLQIPIWALHRWAFCLRTLQQMPLMFSCLIIRVLCYLIYGWFSLSYLFSLVCLLWSTYVGPILHKFLVFLFFVFLFLHFLGYFFILCFG